MLTIDKFFFKNKIYTKLFYLVPKSYFSNKKSLKYRNNIPNDTESIETEKKLINKESLHFTNGKFLIWESGSKIYKYLMIYKYLIIFYVFPTLCYRILLNIYMLDPFSMFQYFFLFYLLMKFFYIPTKTLVRISEKIYLMEDKKRVEICYSANIDKITVDISKIKSHVDKNNDYVKLLNLFLTNKYTKLNLTLSGNEAFNSILMIKEKEIKNKEIFNLISQGKVFKTK
jgi:hypothetical protein